MSRKETLNLKQAFSGKRRVLRRLLLQTTVFAGGILMLGAGRPAAAATLKLGDFTITLQSTLGYTFGERTAPVNNELATLNSDDGDRNFRSGVIANRFQTLEQLNISDGDYGLRASALAYIDTVYLQNSKNNSPNTFNSFGIGPQGFPSGTVANEGRKIEPLALFIYGAEDFDGGNQKLSWQLGRQTITWGESLFSLDGISGLQAPVDAYQGDLLPNPQAQALFLPTGAFSAAYQFANGVSIDGYWQFEFEPDILPGVGSFFSTSDEIGPGAQRILASTISEGAASINRAPDIRPKNGLDQFGFAAHDSIGNYEVGAYFVRGIPKGPNVYTDVGEAVVGGVPVVTDPGVINLAHPNGPQIGLYNIVYAQPVNAFALSASTLFMSANVAGEISDRINQPLISAPNVSSSDPANFNNPLYAIGNVVAAQLSTIYQSPPLPLMPNGGVLEAELNLSDVTSINKNRANLVPGNTSEGGAFEAVWTPNWFPRSDLEIETPVGWTTTFLGDSQFDGSAAGTTTYDVGIEAIYKYNLTIGANYQRYAGPLDRQANLDRDFLTVYVQKTF